MAASRSSHHSNAAQQGLPVAGRQRSLDGGDLEPDDWLAEIRRTERRCGRPMDVITDAFGRPVGELDNEVEDDDE